MKYTEVTFSITPLDPCRDLVVYALGNEGPYDSFVETSGGLKAYVPSNLFDRDWLDRQVDALRGLAQIAFECNDIPDKNWNEEWEKQHQPVLVTSENGQRVWVRAPFHPHNTEA